MDIVSVMLHINDLLLPWVKDKMDYTQPVINGLQIESLKYNIDQIASAEYDVWVYAGKNYRNEVLVNKNTFSIQ